jgi:translation initiation factor 2B subunit (eIF-2B alpha/beta/delta family)
MDLFKQIALDNTSGSGTILKSVQEEILQFLAADEKIEPDMLKKSLRELRAQFPRFGLLIHFIENLEIFFEKASDRMVRKDVEAFIKQYIEKWKNAQDRASEKMIKEADLDQKHVLLHSHSSAIINLFDHLSRKKWQPVIWQTYSSPAGEGIIQAETLNKMGFETHLFHEDALANFIEYIDLAIFGTDLVVRVQFLNKAGTYPLSVFLHNHQKPVYVVGEPRKVFNVSPGERPEFFTEKEKSAAELYRGKSSMQVHNYYFDFTPLTLVKKLILE